MPQKVTGKKGQQRRMQILQYIHDSVMKRGYPPTVREIGQAVRLASPASVHAHLNELITQGLLLKDQTKPRALEITSAGHQALGVAEFSSQIPVVGTVSAGMPILAVENIVDFFPLPANYQSSEDLFMLEINGESMIEAGILNKDLVIVRKQNFADNGDIVIAMTTEQEATCKRFYKEDKQYRLHPENSSMEDIFLESIAIIGKVVGLYRQY